MDQKQNVEMAYNLYNGKMVSIYKESEKQKKLLAGERVIHELYVDRGISQK